MILTKEGNNYLKFLWLSTCCQLIKIR